MDWIIQTGTDSEGNAVTTTLDCQINVTWAYQQHETIDYEDLTNVVIKGEGDVTRKELEEELDRMLEKQGIDKEKTKLNIEMEIQS